VAVTGWFAANRRFADGLQFARGTFASDFSILAASLIPTAFKLLDGMGRVSKLSQVRINSPHAAAYVN